MEVMNTLAFEQGGSDDTAIAAGAMDINIIAVDEFGHGAGNE